jgi:hypothetical protein
MTSHISQRKAGFQFRPDVSYEKQRSTVQEGVQRLEEALVVSRRIATWSLVAVAVDASLCAISAHLVH